MIPFFKKSSYPYLSLLFMSLFLTPAIVNADEAHEKEWFQAGKQAIVKKDWQSYQDYHNKLSRSSLLPYLEFYYYQDRIDETNPQEVLNFANKHANEVFSSTIKSVLFRNRNQAQDYQFILDNAKAINTVNLQCYLYSAQLQKSMLNTADFQKLWSAQLQLPNSCNIVEEYWVKQNQDQSLIKTKVSQLIFSGRLTKAKSLVETLPVADQTYYLYFIDLLNNPVNLLSATQFYPNASKLYAQVIQKWSSQNSLQAETGLLFARDKKLISQQDYIKLRNRIAVFQAGRSDAVAPLQKILDIPEQERDDQLIQWGFRLAAKKGNYPMALALLTNLSPEAQKEDVWQYWLGRANMAIGNHEKAKSYYETIQNQPSFYGFLAADALQHNYTGINAVHKNAAAPKVALPSGFMLSLLLAKVDEEYFSRVKWQEALRNSTKAEQEAGSIAAYEAGFYNLSLQAAARARTENGLKYRYPSAYLPIIQQYTDEFITDAVVLGLIRQESLFHEKAKSQADAYGLMQLLIPTAQSMSRSLNETKRESLYNPDANIRYGINYLKHVQDQVGKCIPYMLASYNAGPHNVKKWIPNTDASTMDIALWIETIPFYETRGYVKNVLGNAVIYHALNENPKRLSDYLQCEDAPRATAVDIVSDTTLINP